MYKLRDGETRIFWDLSLFLTLKRRFSERRHTKKGAKSVATTKKVQLPEGFDPYDMRLKRQFSDQADKMNVIALSRKNYNLCCGAMHNGQPCKNPAGMGTPHKGYGRCKIHGGLATGPKTAEGRARQIAASTKHGLFLRYYFQRKKAF